MIPRCSTRCPLDRGHAGECPTSPKHVVDLCNGTDLCTGEAACSYDLRGRRVFLCLEHLAALSLETGRTVAELAIVLPSFQAEPPGSAPRWEAKHSDTEQPPPDTERPPLNADRLLRACRALSALAAEPRPGMDLWRRACHLLLEEIAGELGDAPPAPAPVPLCPECSSALVQPAQCRASRAARAEPSSARRKGAPG